MSEEGAGWAGRVMGVLRWVEHLVLAQLLLLLGTLAGGVVLGLFPALDAAGRLLARLPAGDPSTSVWRDFWSAWRAGFRRANVVGAPLWAVGALLVVDGGVAALLDGPGRAALVVGLVVVAAWTALVVAFVPPVLRRYDDAALATWRFLLLAPALSPGTSVAVVVTLTAIAATAWFVPVVGVLVGASVALLASGWLVDARLDRIDTRTGS
ncbi:DUF624 domain-containing protein [Cellulomonas sp. DKR-3]|uniref:DUF624 domain-containing protein n=1 Tax=Cellulomonas fulva TaxID=2835530 RepID=A0ABS5TYK5_9CELL|nr:DUF624 domain-containing protein [Cellulomonas fulva]MBT0994207.1 DUF624 domain-containing protein [Cellulomonas fulva]